MLKDIRESYGLTRSELSLLTHRSVNYTLKAEQATFPAAPIALLDFYARPQYEGAYRLTRKWEPYDMDLLRQDYRAFQRRKRHSWLEDWEPLPYTAGLPFRRKWRRRSEASDQAQAWAVGAFDFTQRVNVYSSSYGLSVGLCIPAAVVYRNDKDLTKAGAIGIAMEDLCEFVTSGEYMAERYGEMMLMDEIGSVLRIAKEEGVRLPNGHSEAA